MLKAGRVTYTVTLAGRAGGDVRLTVIGAFSLHITPVSASVTR